MQDVIGATEWWFVRRGMPHAIPDYSAREDVWTRAWPFLLFVLFIELFASFGDRFVGWAQLGVFAAGAGVLLGVFVVVNLLRGRRPFRLPDDIGVFELGAFVLAPAMLPLWFTDRGWSSAAIVVGVNVVVLVLAYAVTSYGLVPALRVGILQAVRQLRTVAQLIARGLPLMLLITAFVFLNAEMWQVAHDFSPAFFAISVGFMVVLALSFLALRVPKEIHELARFDSWRTCCDLVERTDAPIAGDLPTLEGRPPDPDLERVELVNVGILLTISQAVQTLLVGLISGVFYVGFGLLAVRRDTVLQWTTATELDPLWEFGLLGDDVVLTWEHLAVSGFIAAFSVLQFAVASVTDATYRDEFYDDVAGDVRDVLAVRAVVRAASNQPVPEAVGQ
jgi:hypothetical protein